MINSKDNLSNSAKLISPSTWHAQLGVIHSFSDHFQTGIEIAARGIKFSETKQGFLEDKDISLVSFSALVRYGFSPTTLFTFKAGSYATPYVSSKTVGVAHVEVHSVLGPGVSWRQTLWEKSSLQLGSDLEARVLFPTNAGALETKTNPSTAAKLFSKKSFENHFIFESYLGYSWEQQDTDLTRQQTQEWSIGSTLKIPLGETR